MSPGRRAWLARLAAASAGVITLPSPSRAAVAGASPAEAEGARGVRRGRTLHFPRDHGAHPETRIEWWYATGWLGQPEAPAAGFQVTFFRRRSGLAESNRSRFAARHLLFAHAALTDLAAGQHHPAQRIARWSGAAADGPDRASLDDGALQIGRWSLRRTAAHWQADLPAGPFTLELQMAPTQPLLLQGDAGFSRKGPLETQASHYYSEVQLATQARVERDGRRTRASGRAWLDHEWSDDLLHAEAIGWDWIGINLFDGSALTAFQLRRADGFSLWAGGSLRTDNGPPRSFAPEEVRFVALGRRWRSAATTAEYPVQWQIETPAGTWRVNALLDAQEVDSRAGTGSAYWEGLAELLDSAGRRVGLGYLEMTGYAGRLKL